MRRDAGRGENLHGPTGPLTPVRLSRESEYGLEGLRLLAMQPAGRILVLQDIAAARTLPEHFLAKIFQKLRRHGLARSHRGAVRGYSLARPPAAITLREIVVAIEGEDVFGRCIFWPARCNPRRPCSLYHRCVTLRLKFEEMLETTTLEELAAMPLADLRQEHGDSPDEVARLRAEKIIG